MTTSFYVMHLIEGDECVLYHAQTYEAAAAKVEAEPDHIKRNLSIWESTGGIVGMVDPATGKLNRVVRRQKAGV